MPETNELMQAATGETAPQQIERQKAGAVVASMEFGPAGTRDRAEVRDRDFDAEAFASEYPKLSALASGGGQMVAGLVNAVPVVMDYAARLIDKDVTRAPNAPGVDAMLRQSKSLMPEVGRRDMDKAWDKGEFGGWLVTNLIAQTPQMAGLGAVGPVPSAACCGATRHGRPVRRRCLRRGRQLAGCRAGRGGASRWWARRPPLAFSTALPGCAAG